MAKADVHNLEGKKAGTIDLPPQFGEDYRPDVIKRAVLASQSARYQPYGTMPTAGLRSSARFIGRRRKYGTTYGRGMARLPRIRVGSGHMTFRVRIVPHAVKGREAHPPKAEKILLEKINRKERLLAIRSAISATTMPELVTARGHKIGDVQLPIVVVDDLEEVSKPKELVAVLEKLGLGEELERTSEPRKKAGIGKMRGRRKREKKGPLIVVGTDKGVGLAARNIPGVEVARVDNLSAELLAPGTHAGRLTIWTKSAILALGEKNLYMG